jgi:hypothetical protein
VNIHFVILSICIYFVNTFACVSRLSSRSNETSFDAECGPGSLGGVASHLAPTGQLHQAELAGLMDLTRSLSFGLDNEIENQKSLLISMT